jgi:hypothetical protein
VVAGLHVRGKYVPRFALDDEQRIYVSMPAPNADDATLYDGRILRFNIDGSAAGVGASALPIVSEGFSIPRALRWDGAALWLAGAGGGAHGMARLSFDERGNVPASSALRSSVIALDSFDVMAFDVRALDVATTAPRSVAFLDHDNQLRSVALRRNDVVRPLQPIAWSRTEQPVSLAMDSKGSLVVVAKSRAGTFAIVRLSNAN